MSEVFPVGRHAFADDRQTFNPVGRRRRPLLQDVRNSLGQIFHVVGERGHKEGKRCSQNKDNQHRHDCCGNCAVSSDRTLALAVERPRRVTDHRSPQYGRQEGPKDQGTSNNQQGKRTDTENRPYPSAKI